jgi:hypothetical protein
MIEHGQADFPQNSRHGKWRLNMRYKTSGLKQRADGTRYMLAQVLDGWSIESAEIELPAEEPHDLTAEIHFIRTGGREHELQTR